MSTNSSVSNEELQAQINSLTQETDVFYLFWASTLVFSMQMGFAMLSAGAVRKKNVQNIMLKGVLDACLGAIIWYLWGYGIAYDGDVGVDGHEGNPFMGTGTTNYALSGLIGDGQAPHGSDWVMWFFQYAFAAAGATIVSGAVAERCNLTAYLVYTGVITGFVYPIVVHWAWDSSGFLSAGNSDNDVRWGTGVIDFGGSGVVHMTGGMAAVVSAKILGPRRGRFDENGKPNPGFMGHSTALTVLGTFMLWIGWYGFNQGSTLVLHDNAQVSARVGVTTTLSGATAGVVGLYVKRVLPPRLGGDHVWDLCHTCNSLLAGLVAITAGCATSEPYAALFIGAVAALGYHGGSCLMRQLHIDDPLDAFAVHGVNGFIGLIAVGLFATKEYTFVTDDDGNQEYGIFYGGSGLLLGTQLSAAAIMILWDVSMSLLLFLSLHYSGMFRVGIDMELVGLDKSKHGGDAYPDNPEPPHRYKISPEPDEVESSPSKRTKGKPSS